MTTTGSGSVSNSAVCFLQMLREQKDGSLQILLHGHPSLAVPAAAPIAPHGSTRAASLLQVWVTGNTEAESTGRSSSCDAENPQLFYRLWIKITPGAKLFLNYGISFVSVLCRDGKRYVKTYFKIGYPNFKYQNKLLLRNRYHKWNLTVFQTGRQLQGISYIFQ